MSRIGSSSASGVRVAAEPISNVFTVLLLIGALALALSLVMLWATLESRYGVTFAVSDPGKAALNAPKAAESKEQAAAKDLDEKLQAIRSFSQEIAAPAAGAAAPPAAAPPAEAPPAAAPPAAAPPAEAPPAAAPPAEAPPAAAPPAEAPPAAAPPAEAPPAAAPPAEAPPMETPPAAAPAAAPPAGG
jgi:hypothetical protein